MYENLDFLIVGAGLFGCVCAHELKRRGYNALVIEKRPYVGGNCHDSVDETTGIRYHTHGPHIFHCNDDAILSYIKQFCEFNGYFHQVLTEHEGELYQLPINLFTINKFFKKKFNPEEAQNFLVTQIQKNYIPNPENLEQQLLNLSGKDIYRAFFEGYTEKQWGKHPLNLPPDLIKRIPFRFNYNSCYYNKKFHGIPLGGYAAIFRKLLKGVDVETKCDFHAIKPLLNPDIKIIYSGPIDRFFDYDLGHLEYRALKFEKEILPVSDFQGNAVINYADKKIPFTRITEPAHFHPEEKKEEKRTIIFREYSIPDNGANPYYPVTDARNLKLRAAYMERAAKIKNFYPGGRLGEFRYYDMEETIRSALRLVNIIHEGAIASKA